MIYGLISIILLAAIFYYVVSKCGETSEEDEYESWYCDKDSK